MTNDQAPQTPGAIAPEDEAFKLVPMPAPFGQPPEAAMGRRIHAARNHYKLSVEALSRLTKNLDTDESKGISPPSLARYESSANLPGARELRLLCEALEVSADWLIYGKIATAGKSAAEQQLVDAIRGMIAERRDDHEIAGMPVSEHIAAQAKFKRMALLQEARKPSV